MRSIEDWPVAKAAERIRKREAEREAELVKRRIRAREWAAIVAKKIGNADPEVEQVIGFGSTFEEWRNYRLNSDVDLAIIGGDWFRATAQIPIGGFETTVVELMLQNEDFIQYVRQHGVVLYEK